MTQRANNSLAKAFLIAFPAATKVRSRRLAAQAALLTVSTLVAFGWGCGSQEAPDPAATTRTDSQTASDRPQPRSGKAHVEYVDGRVTVRSDGSLRLAVLEQLGELAGFEIVAGKTDTQPLTLQIERAALVEAVALILEGLTYTLEYDFDPASETRTLVRIQIGDTLAYDTTTLENEASTNTLPNRASSAAPRDPAKPRSETDADEQAELLSELDSSDPEARTDAAEWIELEGKSLERILSLLASDPDPNVRATIVDRLSEDPSPATIPALVAALRDPDSEVVLRAIEALEFEDESWLIPELKPLLAHSDPEIREAAEDAIMYLE